MRHLHFVQSVEPLQGGGLGSSTLQLHNALGRRGGSEVLTTREASFDSYWSGVKQAVRVGPTAIYYSPQLRKIAKDSVKEADWVHAHGLYVHTNSVLGSECRKQQKPYAYHIHGFFDPWILNRSRKKKWIVNRIFESRNLKGASFFRALTNKEKQQIVSYGLTQRILVIPNGIDLSEVDAPMGDASNHQTNNEQSHQKPFKRLLFLSRIHPKKGLDLLIPAWAELAEQFPDWELAIVGPDEGGYLKRVRALIQSHCVAARCKVLPSVSGPQKWATFQSADAFVLPSYSEGFPMVALEAMAHRLPVILTNECNFPEAAGAEAGWECIPEKESLTVALRDALLADDEERIQRGQLGRELVENRYTWDKVAGALENACDSYA